MNGLRKIALAFLGIGALFMGLPGAGAESLSTAPGSAFVLPASEWWLVIHDQCNDTLHWVMPSGEYTSIPRPQLPSEAAGSPCSSKAMHISQNGRYLVEIAPLTTGQTGIGFYDLQTGQWLMVHQTQPNEQAYLGDRYSSDAYNRIAISFASDPAAPRAWRVIVFDMSTGNALEQLLSSGTEIASFVGGEFLASAMAVPHVVLLSPDAGGSSYQVHVRFDAFGGTTAPLGSIAWYPQGVPGLGQELISGPYRVSDLDILPNGHAILAYQETAYPAGPAVGEDLMHAITTNAIGLLPADASNPSAAVQLFYADAVSTFYGPRWAADGRIAVFKQSDGVTPHVYWNTLGTATLNQLPEAAAQILGVPTGFVYNTAGGLYFQSEGTTTPVGPILSGAMFSGGMAFIWASASGSPVLALDNPVPYAGGFALPTPVPTLVPGGLVVATPVPTPVPGGGAAGQPDLFVSEFSLNPATPTQGQAVEVRVGVYNQGDAAVSGINFQIDWWPGENYPSPACNWTLDSMAARGGRILTCTYAGYPSPYSGINTKVAVDTGNAVAESNEGNNVYLQPISVSAPAPAAQPDLFVSEFSLNPATPTQGQAVEVRVGVYNQGDAAVSGINFQIDWWPGENYPSPACNWTLDSMAARGGRILTCTYAGYPSPYSAINTKVAVDTGNAIAESNEGNNVYTQPISVNAPAPAAQPDLYVSEFSLNPATPTKGQAVEVRVGVYNQGNAAVSGSFQIAWWPGENYPSPACNWTLDSMAARGGRILTCTYAGYPSPYSGITTKVAVDTTNAIAESNEGNNVYTQSVRVNAP